MPPDVEPSTRPGWSAPWRRTGPPRAPGVRERYGLHIALFLLTLATTTLAGADMAGRFLLYEAADRWLAFGAFRISVDYLLDGARFGGSLLLFLTVHEFGHYFAARRHRVRTSLPYYIPFPFNGIGTFGAVIRIRQQIPSLRTLFDIGAAGPLAGFVVALGLTVYGLATLEPPTYLLDVPGHEALKEWIGRTGTFPPTMLREPGMEGGFTLVLGQTPLFWLLSQGFDHVPPMWELYHYPVLFAGWLGLFFTALNLLPVGQLDGGHILYALLGSRRHRTVARAFVLVLLLSGAIGFAGEMETLVGTDFRFVAFAWLGLSALLYFYLWRILELDVLRTGWATVALVAIVASALLGGEPVARFGYSGWLVWSLLIVFLVRVEHPPVLYQEPLTPGRRWAAYASMVIFVLCFSLRPLSVV